MKQKLYVPFLFMAIPFFLQAADSASNRKDQTLRLGGKSGVHFFYATASPIVLEIPGENWSFGLATGSGVYSYTTSSSGTSETLSVNTSLTEINGRYYIGNSFNIPFGYGMYKVSWDNWVYSGATYDLEYSINQLNIGIGNEWTYDWGGFLGIDWFQSGSKLSDKITVALKSGTESATTLAKAEKKGTDIPAISGAFIFTFGFGF